MNNDDLAGTFSALVKLQRTSATWTGILGLAALGSELATRLMGLQDSSGVLLLAAVAIGALAGQTVPLRRNGHVAVSPPK